MCSTTQHVVNIMTLKKINILEYTLEGVIKKKEYSLYAFINVDNCERPLNIFRFNSLSVCACAFVCMHVLVMCIFTKCAYKRG